MVKESDKGLLIIYTGNGKGKTTAALGTALRALGYDWKVCMLQFIKGDWKYGELESVKCFGERFELHVTGRGFCGIGDDRLPFEEHRQAALEGLQLAREKLGSGKYQLIILDEILVAIQLKLLSEDEVLTILETADRDVNVILTGRGASEKLIERADLVTEMREIKHPFQKGILARKGIDF